MPADEARKKLPLVSIRSRLPQGKPVTPAVQINDRRVWSRFDSSLKVIGTNRADTLRKLHEGTTLGFVESSGFGAGRVILKPDRLIVEESFYSNAMKQPGKAASFGKSADESLVLVKPGAPDTYYYEQHSHLMLNFFLPQVFGYVRDIDHVAGFGAHGFREEGMVYDEEWTWLLEDLDPWRVDHVQLIGILTQPEPIVYLTDRMPSMEQISQNKTRKLDAFEEKGLKELYRGEDLFIAEKGGETRMLGALRARPTCIQCHDSAKEYDLLGAFSYTLRRTGK